MSVHNFTVRRTGTTQLGGVASLFEPSVDPFFGESAGIAAPKKPPELEITQLQMLVLESMTQRLQSVQYVTVTKRVGQLTVL